MAIRFNVVSRKNPIKGGVKYYGVQNTSGKVEIEELCDRIEKRSTVSSADVKAVLDAMEYEVTQALLDGKTVDFRDFFTVRASISCTGADTPEAFTARNITKVRPVFKAKRSLLAAFAVGGAAQRVKFEKIESLVEE